MYKKYEVPDEIWNYIKNFVFDKSFWKKLHRKKLHRVIFSFPGFCWKMKPIVSWTSFMLPAYNNTNDIIREFGEDIPENLTINEHRTEFREDGIPPNLKLTSISYCPNNQQWKFEYGWKKIYCL